MMTFFLPRWQYWRLMLDGRMSLGWTEVRRRHPRVRPYLVALEERAVPASGTGAFLAKMDDPEAQIQIGMDIDHPNPKFMGIADPAAALTTVPAEDEDAVEVTPQTTPGATVTTTGSAEAEDTVVVTPERKKPKHVKTNDNDRSGQHKNADK